MEVRALWMAAPPFPPALYLQAAAESLPEGSLLPRWRGSVGVLVALVLQVLESVFILEMNGSGLETPPSGSRWYCTCCFLSSDQTSTSDTLFTLPLPASRVLWTPTDLETPTRCVVWTVVVSWHTLALSKAPERNSWPSAHVPVKTPHPSWLHVAEKKG